MKISLNLTKTEFWTSSITGVFGTIFIHFLLGPIYDKYGPRIPFSMVLCGASIPTAMTGLVNTAASLATIRFFIGLAGSTFVTCQYWSSRMFAKEVVGTANALTARWGNLGGGVTQLVMGSLLFPLFKLIFQDNENPSKRAWRIVCIVPAIVAFLSGVMIYTTSDDFPKGNYSDMKKKGLMGQVSATNSFRAASFNVNTSLLFI